MDNEAKLRADIESIKVAALDTPSLYREVCTLMFFRYGITPTANKLYQYVHRGSMSAPAEALAKFWGDLREKSRVRIEHPDLPEAVKVAAGELLAGLWSQARKFADDGLNGFREELTLRLNDAQREKDAAEQARMVAEQAGARMQGQISHLENSIQQLEKKLAAAEAKGESLKEQLNGANEQRINSEAALAEARRDYSNELEKFRQELRRAEERLAADERRALLEIDKERQLAIKARKETELVRQASQEQTERQQVEMVRVQRELAETRQRLGVAEGALTEMRSRHELQIREIELLRQVLVEDKSRMVFLENALARNQQQKFSRERFGVSGGAPKKLRRNRKPQE